MTKAVATPQAEPVELGADTDSGADSGKMGFFGLSGAEQAAVLGLPHEDASKVKVTRTTSTDPQGEEEAEAQAEAEADPDPDSDSEGEFEFAGKQYRSRAAAEQALRTFRGQARSAAERSRALEAEVARLKAAPPQHKQPVADKGDSPARTPALPSAVAESDSLLGLTNDDLAYVSELFKANRVADANLFILAKQETAIKAQVEAMAKQIRDEFKGELGRVSEPILRRQSEEALETKAADVLRAGLEALDPETEEPIYPELRQEVHLDSFIQTWRELTEGDSSGSMPLDFALTHAGRHMAYLYWKAHRYEGQGGAPVEKPTSKTPASPSTPSHPGRISAPVQLRSAPSRPALQPSAPKNPIERAFTREDQASDDLF